MPSTKKRAIAGKRRQEVAEMYLAGKHQSEIAEHFGVSQVTISKDIKILQREWQKEATMSVAEVISRELQELKRLKKEHKEAYNRSTKNSNGDPRFLDGILKCTEQILKIVGGYAPVKGEYTDKNMPDYSSLTFDQLYELKYGRKPVNEDDGPVRGN